MLFRRPGMVWGKSKYGREKGWRGMYDVGEDSVHGFAVVADERAGDADDAHAFASEGGGG